MFRVLFVVYRKLELNHQEFLENYLDVHVPIARTFRKLRDYQIWPVAEEPGENQPDAFAVMTFDTPEDFQTVTESDEFAQATIDNEKFVSRFETFPVSHVEVVRGDLPVSSANLQR